MIQDPLLGTGVRIGVPCARSSSAVMLKLLAAILTPTPIVANSREASTIQSAWAVVLLLNVVSR